MRTFTTKHTVYTFDELSDDGKQKAIIETIEANEYEFYEDGGIA